VTGFAKGPSHAGEIQKTFSDGQRLSLSDTGTHSIKDGAEHRRSRNQGVNFKPGDTGYRFLQIASDFAASKGEFSCRAVSCEAALYLLFD
jgi:hypothetical protein